MNLKNYTLCIALAMMFTATSQSTSNRDTQSESTQIKRVRIDLQTPSGYTRQLLLGFMPNDEATDGFDYGYDALNNDNYADDFGWTINNDSYIIQGVGSFTIDKYYPIGTFLSNSGTVSINLQGLENFDETINVYVYDTITGLYTNIKDTVLTTDVIAGDYNKRFFLTFRNNFPTSFWNEVLSVASQIKASDITIAYNKNQKNIVVKSNGSQSIKFLKVYDVLGKEILVTNNIHTTVLKVPTFNLTKGVYIIKLGTELIEVNKKIIIN